MSDMKFQYEIEKHSKHLYLKVKVHCNNHTAGGKE